MATPEWNLWLNMATWNEGDAVLLALNIDPLKSEPRKLHKSDETVQQMGRLFALLKNHDEARNFSRRLDSGLSPREFATFFVKIGWSIPQELAALAVNAPQATPAAQAEGVTVTAPATDVKHDNDYQSLRELILPHIDKKFDELPEELRPIVKDAFTIHWDDLTTEGRLESAKQHDDHYDPSLAGKRHVDWYNNELSASIWWQLKNIKPLEAAKLLCQFNPHNNNDDPIAVTNLETAPEDYKLLLRVFEDEEKADAKARNLSQWRDIAREKKLKYHSWIDKYEQAMKLPESVAPVAKVEAGSAITIHKLKTKNMPLDAEIATAKTRALDKTNAQSVWDELVKMASKQEGCLIGEGDLNELQYGSRQAPQIFTKKMLTDRMRERKNRTKPR